MKFGNLIIGVLILYIINKLAGRLKIIINSKYKIEWYKYGFLSRKDLVKLTPIEFKKWCTSFMERSGYYNVVQDNFSSITNNNYFYCRKDNVRYYVLCHLTEEKDEKEDDYEEFSRSQFQRFIGTLEHDRISHGIILTTGDLSKDSIGYFNSIPKRFHIEVIDGINLNKAYRKLRNKEVYLSIQ